MTPPLGIDPGGRYGVVAEDQVLESLALHCWPHELRWGDAAAARCQAETTLQRWLTQGLPYRNADGRRWFDLCQVLNFLRWTGRVNDDPAYWEAAVPSFRRMLREMGFSCGEEALPPPARFQVEFRREFQLPPGTARERVHLRLPRPYEDSAQHDIHIERITPADPAIPMSDTPGRLELRVPASAAAQVIALEACYRFTAHCVHFAVDPAALQPYDRSDPEYQLYTRPMEGWLRVSPAVDQLAEQLAGNAENPWAALCSFWDFFFDRMNSGYIHHDELDPGDPLGSLVRRGWFDCLLGSSLLAALCRARGMPARLVGGWNLHEVNPTQHYWAEVWLPPYGWVPVDLASWLLEGRQPSAWGRCFLGRLDYRMKTECYPRITLGIPGIRFPAAWYVVPRLTADGVEWALHGLEPPRLLFRDSIRVRRLTTDDSR